MREDWVEAELGEVFQTVTGTTPSKKEIDNYGSLLPFIKPPDINNEIINTASEHLSEKGKNKSRILPKNSVLVTCIGNLGRIGINKTEIAFNQQINAILPIKEIAPKFIFFQAQSVNFRNQLEALSTSTTVALVNKSSFNTIKVEVAPLPIQRAIVLKIENLFASLDKGIADLKTAQEQLKVYRQAVLKKAFEGGFTVVSSASTTDAVPEVLEVTDTKNNLPKGWKWVKLGEVCEKITDGSHFSPKSVGDGYPYITVKDLNNDLIDFKSCLNISEDDYLKLKANDCKPKINDVLFSKDGTVGKVAIIDFEKEFVVLSSLAILRTNINLISPKYLFWTLKSTDFLNQALSNKKGVAIRRIILRDLKELILNIPPTLSEQTTIVREIESRLSVCDKVEQNISEALEKAEALRQSILKKAFEGKLLTEAEIAKCKQEADYEPAAKLLERINNGKTKK